MVNPSVTTNYASPSSTGCYEMQQLEPNLALHLFANLLECVDKGVYAGLVEALRVSVEGDQQTSLIVRKMEGYGTAGTQINMLLFAFVFAFAFTFVGHKTPLVGR